ncbi:hypothetical protein GCM10009809_27180 [Isoptericola hypogeus]|uniref:RAMA domain-containing protein n=1 Tax=Isoptericola hypogeus TaxID=300179 RepID=A0ABP4VKN1_9MICO
MRRRSRAERFSAPEPAPHAPEPTPHAPEPHDRAAGASRAPGLGEAFAAVAAPAFDLPVPAPWSAPEAEPAIPEPRWSGADDELPRLQVPPLEPPRLRVPPLDAPRLDGHWADPLPERPAAEGYDWQARPAADPLTAPAGAWSPPEETTQAGWPASSDEVDGDLVDLARRLGRPTAILWSRPRRRQHFEAVLHPDGVIELADGRRYRHPDHAASAASGSPTADGWNVWRLAAGPGSLLDAYRAHFA